MDSPAGEEAWSAVFAEPRDGLRQLGTARDDWAAWGRAVCLMATGDYAQAFAGLEPLARGTSEVAGLASAAIASGLRQLDEHAAAMPYDEAARAAPGAAAADGLIGAAADQVGMADAAAARAALEVALPHLRTWRDRVRYGWVATESALLDDDAGAAVAHADLALGESRQHRSPRHRIKSTLFAAVARRTLGVPGTAADLHGVAEECGRLGLLPLLWPAVAVLGPDATAEETASARGAVAYIGARLPDGIGSRWGGFRAFPADTL